MNWSDQLLAVYDLHFCSRYQQTWDLQKEWVQEVARQERLPSLLFVEHQHVYTFGRGARAEHLLISPEQCAQLGIELADIDRGGDITYHGPGQLVGYPILCLQKLNNDAHLYLRKLEEVLIQTLAEFGLSGHRKEQYTGVWIGDEKIAAIGVKFNRAAHLKSFVTSHGFALNVFPDLHMFEYIIPCGIRQYGVTSMEKCLDHKISLEEIALVLQDKFCQEFQLSQIKTPSGDEE